MAVTFFEKLMIQHLCQPSGDVSHTHLAVSGLLCKLAFRLVVQIDLYIIDVIRDSVDIISVMKPVYNFKASD